MRFALIATTAAAVVAVPMAVSAAAPSMTSSEFLSAVRCTAYEQVIAPTADINLQKLRLNVEAQRQPAATAQRAEAEAHAIAVAAQTDASASPCAQTARRI